MSEFDRFSQDYDSRLSDSIKGLASVDNALESKVRVLQRVMGEELDRGDRRILDFGCGTGLLTAVLRQFPSQVTGVDVSVDSLRHSVCTQGGFVAFDGLKLPFGEGSFNLAIASCVFHHIDPAVRQQVLEDIYRILAPGGILFVIEHNPYNPVTRYVVNRCEFDQDAQLLTMKSMASLLRASGFREYSMGYYYLVPPLGKTRSRIDSWFSGVPLGAQYYCAFQKAGSEPVTETPEASLAAL
jgi:SAM-dependent methyltransferase